MGAARKFHYGVKAATRSWLPWRSDGWRGHRSQLGRGEAIFATGVCDASCAAKPISSDSNSLALARQPAAQVAGDASFASVLKEAIGSVAEMGRKSDVQMRAAANGKANIVDVVTAVSETEVAIDAVVAVRDRVIQAYEDIMKMPI